MKALDHLISSARIEGVLDLRCLLNGPLDIDHAPEPPGVAAFHVVLSGVCSMRLAGSPVVTLTAGDIAVLPRGDAHTIAVAGAPAQRREVNTQFNGAINVRSNVVSGPPALDLLCGRFAYATPAALMDSLPTLLHVNCMDPTLEMVVATLRREAENPGLGARSIMGAMSTALFTMILRTWLTQAPPIAGILALLSHSRIGPAVLRMLEAPGEQWTLTRLADQAAMSRASFMRAYASLSDESPLQLLGGIRMQVASRLLVESHRKIGDIADAVGYISETAFAKKFKDVFQLSPGRYRQVQRDGPRKGHSSQG